MSYSVVMQKQPFKFWKMSKGFRFQCFYLIKVQIPENMLNKKKNTETIFLMKVKYFKEFIVSMLFTDLNGHSDVAAFFCYHLNLILESEK